MRDFEIVTICPFCKAEHYVMVADDDYAAYLDGMSVQDAFPYLSANERELIMTGICPACWDDMWKTEALANAEPMDLIPSNLNTYINYATNQPMTDGEEIRDFFDNLK